MLCGVQMIIITSSGHPEVVNQAIQQAVVDFLLLPSITEV